MTEDDWGIVADCAKENINFSLWEEALKAQNYVVPRVYELSATWDEGNTSDASDWRKSIEKKIMQAKPRKRHKRVSAYCLREVIQANRVK